MKYLRTQEIALADIEVPKRLRPVDKDWAEVIASRMAEAGQQTPIEVVEQIKGKKYRLLAGGHRVAAARINGWETIRAEIKSPDNPKKGERDLELLLHEIDENLIRHELNPLDRAVFLGRRQEIYEQIYPETKAGVAGGKARQGTAGEIFSFAAETAERTGLGERTIQRATRIYKGLAPEIRARLAGSHVAKKEGELYELTRYSPEQQKTIVDWCLETVAAGAPPNYATVSMGRQLVDNKSVKPPKPHEVQAKKLREAWDRAGKRAQVAHLTFLKDIGVIDSFTTEHL